MTATRSDLPFSVRRASLEALLASGPVAGSVRAEAHYVLWELCQACGDPEAAASHLAAATAINPLRSRLVAGATPRRSVLLLAAPGDFQANLPIDLLLDGTTALHTFRILDPRRAVETPEAVVAEAGLPPVDAVMIVIAEGADRGPVLDAADALARALGRPTLNRGRRVAALSRPGAADLLRGLPDLVVPMPRTGTRASFAGDPPNPPFLLRPLSSHAGRDLALVADKGAAEAAFRTGSSDDLLTATPFVAYASRDGLHRKYRFALVGGRAFPVHLAIGADWALWYYNAGMEHAPSRRREEAAFLDDHEAVLPSRARTALAALAARLGLDYVGLDCGLLPDGRLVLFEVETGLLVHDRDPPDLFPAKPRAARRIAAALEALIDGRIASTGR